jgi:glycosyltransferase involved in cell wall biosynthesis
MSATPTEAAFVAPLRVAHVVGGTRAGSTRVVLNLVAHAERARIEPSICFFAISPAEPEVVAEVGAIGVPWREVVKRSRFELGAFDRLAAALRALTPELVVVHGFGAYSYGALAARAAGARWVVRVEHSPELYGPHYQLVSAASAAWVDSTILVSRYVGDYVAARGVTLPRPEVIYNGIALERLLAVDEPPFPDGRPGPPRVAMIARLDEAKDHETLLAAAQALARRGRPIALALAGDGPYRARLEEEARRRAIDVRFLGFVVDLPSLFCETDIAVLSTRFEGFGLAIVEAMAAGRPVVATRVAAVPEVLDDGVEGLLVPPRDPDALAAAIAALADDPTRARAMGLAGRARAATRYALLPSVRRFEAHLLRTAGRG